MSEFDYSLLNNFEKIYVLVSGGIDSTYLYEKIRSLYLEKTHPVNCYNPYENNETLREISRDNHFIQIKRNNDINYGDVIRESFLKLPEAYELKKQKIYHKKIFPCCYYIKHKMFLKDSRFLEDNVVIISGIKAGDGNQRNHWLRKLRNEDTFFHRHKTGHLYCYPFRDYFYRQLSPEMIDPLYKKYPFLTHSGCFLCPILVLFELKGEGKRYKESVRYAQKLGVYPNRTINEFIIKEEE